jgi:hypothetical protein
MSDYQIETEKRLRILERKLQTVSSLLIFTMSLGTTMLAVSILLYRMVIK